MPSWLNCAWRCLSHSFSNLKSLESSPFSCANDSQLKDAHVRCVKKTNTYLTKVYFQTQHTTDAVCACYQFVLLHLGVKNAQAFLLVQVRRGVLIDQCACRLLASGGLWWYKESLSNAEKCKLIRDLPTSHANWSRRLMVFNNSSIRRLLHVRRRDYIPIAEPWRR